MTNSKQNIKDDWISEKKKKPEQFKSNHIFPFRELPWAMRENSTMDRLKNHIMPFQSCLFNTNNTGRYWKEFSYIT